MEGGSFAVEVDSDGGRLMVLNSSSIRSFARRTCKRNMEKKNNYKIDWKFNQIDQKSHLGLKIKGAALRLVIDFEQMFVLFFDLFRIQTLVHI